MPTPSLFPMFLKAQVGGAIGTEFVETFEVETMDDLIQIETVEVVDVEVVDEVIDIEVVEVIDVEVECG